MLIETGPRWPLIALLMAVLVLLGYDKIVPSRFVRHDSVALEAVRHLAVPAAQVRKGRK